MSYAFLSAAIQCTCFDLQKGWHFSLKQCKIRFKFAMHVSHLFQQILLWGDLPRNRLHASEELLRGQLMDIQRQAGNIAPVPTHVAVDGGEWISEEPHVCMQLKSQTEVNKESLTFIILNLLR